MYCTARRPFSLKETLTKKRLQSNLTSLQNSNPFITLFITHRHQDTLLPTRQYQDLFFSSISNISLSLLILFFSNSVYVLSNQIQSKAKKQTSSRIQNITLNQYTHKNTTIVLFCDAMRTQREFQGWKKRFNRLQFSRVLKDTYIMHDVKLLLCGDPAADTAIRGREFTVKNLRLCRAVKSAAVKKNPEIPSTLS